MSCNHAGGLLGLTPPDRIDARTRATQEPLWAWYVKALQDIGPVDLAIHLGDMVDGEGKAETLGLFTTDTKDQAALAAESLRLVQTDRWALCYGTPFHTVGTYSYEELVADALSTKIADTQYLEVNGLRISARHVVGRSDTPYGQGTLAHKEVMRDFFLAIREGSEPADLVLRGHVHLFWETGSLTQRGVLCPCLQTPGGIYGRKMRGWGYDMGMLLVTVPASGRLWDVKIDPVSVDFAVRGRREYVKI